MAEPEKTTDIYWKIFGILGLGIGIGFILSKWSKGKSDNNVVNNMTAKAELSKIIGEAKKEPVDSNVQTTVEDPNKVMSGEMRSSAFKEDGKQDVAAPTIIQVENKQPVNDVGRQQQQEEVQVQIPGNAFTSGNGQGFEEGDVICSLGNQSAKTARVVSGNYSFVDKSGNNLGSLNFNHCQKLGVITAKEPNGVYFKVAPEWKKHGFIEFKKIYKLV